jgi:hypothetical protein
VPCASRKRNVFRQKWRTQGDIRINRTKKPAVSATRARLNGHKILPAQTKKSFLHGIMRRLDVSRDFLGVTDKNTLKALDCTWDDFSAVMGGFNWSTLKAEFY